MTDISRNWYDLSVNSNILKQTYFNGFIDVSNNIVGRENMWIKNEKYIGDTRFGLGTMDPSATVHITSDDPTIQMTNRTITQSTTNNTNLGRINFEDSAHIRCENIGNETDGTGSLIFSTNNADNFVIRSNGNVGIGLAEPTITGEKLQIKDGRINLGTNSFVHCDGTLTLSSSKNIYIVSNPSYPIIMGGGSSINTDSTKNFDYDDAFPMRQEVMRIGDDGRVGIMTNSPASTFHVNGDTTVNGPLYYRIYNDYYATATQGNSFYNWNATLDNHSWKSNVSIVLPSKGIWFIYAGWDIKEKTNTETIVWSFGIGLGTDTGGSNLALQNFHKRHSVGIVRTVENNTNRREWLSDRKAGRLHISTCYVNTVPGKRIYMGHILTSKAPESRPSTGDRLQCLATITAFKLSHIE